MWSVSLCTQPKGVGTVLTDRFRPISFKDMKIKHKLIVVMMLLIILFCSLLAMIQIRGTFKGNVGFYVQDWKCLPDGSSFLFIYREFYVASCPQCQKVSSLLLNFIYQY